jgi:deoxyribose-phosphate aldolase
MPTPATPPATALTVAGLAKMIDHSLLLPTMTTHDIERGCEVAARLQVASVCARPCDVPLVKRLLTGSGVAVCTVIGFPHGTSATAVKAEETRVAVAQGAQEVDMVLNISRLLSGDVAEVEADIRAVVEAAAGATVKVILENAYLTNDEKVLGCQAAERAGAAFVKTSTGFAASGATVEDVRLMRATVSPHVQVKAAGGIRTLDLLLELHAAGATRFGATASAAMLEEMAHRH